MADFRFQTIMKNPLNVLFWLGIISASMGAISDLIKMLKVENMFQAGADLLYLVSFTACIIIYLKNRNNLRISLGIYFFTIVLGFVIVNLHRHINGICIYNFLQDTIAYVMIITIAGAFYSGFYVIILNIIYSGTLIAIWYLSGDKLGDISILFLLTIMAGYTCAMILFPKKFRKAFLENEKLHALVAKNEKQLLEKENQKIAGEVKMLKETIELKNRELVSKALILTTQKEKNARLAQKLKKVNTKQVDELKAVIDELQTEDTVYLKEFQVRFNEVHQNFYTNLKADFPNLTTGELNLAAFLKLQLSSKEIAILTNTTKAGINVSRSRLRKKLKMDNKDNFIDFLEKY